MQKVFNVYYSVGKKTFQIIYQLSCFVGHPVYLIMLYTGIHIPILKGGVYCPPLHCWIPSTVFLTDQKRTTINSAKVF